MTDFDKKLSNVDQASYAVSLGDRHLCLHAGIGKDQTTLKTRLFDLQENEIFGIYGPAKSGKSALLRFLDMALSQEILPDGAVLASRNVLDGQDTVKALAPALERPLAMDLSALEALISVLQPFDLAQPSTRTRLKRALRYLCHEGEIYSQPLGEASQAMVTKVALLRALLNPPAYLLLDEPTKGLTTRCKVEVHDLVRRFQDESDTTIIMATKDPAEAEALCDRLALVEKGRVLAIGAPPALTEMLDPRLTKGSSLLQLHNQLTGDGAPIVG
jgi:ABC-2 type transport system ATP-binding protein